MVILSIFLTNGIFYGHLIHFVAIWYSIPRFGMLYQEKSGNPAFSNNSGDMSDILIRKEMSLLTFSRGQYFATLVGPRGLKFSPRGELGPQG
jgi:hypothetical protein